MQCPVLLWFRHDLRLSDNEALRAACENGRPVMPVFVLDDAAAGDWRAGGASRWWLHESLKNLQASLEEKGSRLILRRGRTEKTIAELAAETGAKAIHFSHQYEPYARKLENRLSKKLKGKAELKGHPGYLLAEPGTILTGDDKPYKVFTPFYKAMRKALDPSSPLHAPQTITCPETWPETEKLEDWELQPQNPDWAGGLRDRWRPGEDGAQRAMDRFIDRWLADYDELRDRPDKPATSFLSPHLHFGEISPRRVWHRIDQAALSDPANQTGGNSFLRELIWRDFSHQLLWHWPDLPDQPFKTEYKKFPWRQDSEGLSAWQKGETGYPLIDAGMRELWQTGWMHNRVRMVAASFLVKDLLIPWREGERWFWDTLVDADLANNAANWQWVAGCGADAAPYFRIFNPVLQSRKFDPGGDYIRRWIPELQDLPDSHIHTPWQASGNLLVESGIRLGKTYPERVVDHAWARERALEALSHIKKKGN